MRAGSIKTLSAYKLGFSGCSLFAVLAMSAAEPAAAQTSQPGEEAPAASASEAAAAEPDEPNGEVVVTASRIARAGFEAPTPTTVIDNDQLREGGRATISSALTDIPQIRGTLTPNTQSTFTNSGTAVVDLRGLGVNRTLVLVDSKRHIAANLNVNLIPATILSRVEVVTGGASAAWGSGAVAGVVNLIPDDRLDRFQARGQFGISTRGDGEEYQLGASFGTFFADERGHVILAAEHTDNRGIRPKTSRHWTAKWNQIANPAYTPTNGEPQFILSPDVNYSNASLGGLIVQGPLAGTEFGPGGVPRPFEYGSLRGPALMVGGAGSHNSDFTALTGPFRTTSVYGRLTYDLLDNLRIEADALYAHSKTDSDFFPDNNLGNLTVSRDNAFLPQSIRDQMIARGLTTLRMGRVNRDFGLVRLIASYEVLQGSIGLSGDFGKNWKWDAYYAHGTSEAPNTLANQRITSLFNESLDSVIGPGGKPICRSALTVPTTACVPINIFGDGSAQPEAVRYFMGAATANPKVKLDVAAVSLRGEPFELPAGPVSVALGAEWRKDSIFTKIDDLSRAGRFNVLNGSLREGDTSVKEAFAEVLVPLLADIPFVKALDLSGAVRLSDYQRSGSITSWKIGANYALADALRFRATRSRDIRAPSLTELFSTQNVTFTTVTDPDTNIQTSIRAIGGGNPDLNPEKADTTTLGVIYRPAWAGNLNISVDYYNIDIKGAISSVSAQDAVTRCAAGNQILCDRITRDSAGLITEVSVPLINLSQFKMNGLDIEAAYSTPLAALSSRLPGRLTFRLLANYVNKLILDDGRTRTNLAGDLGSTVAQGVPRWRGMLSATYEGSRAEVNVRARYIHGGHFNHLVSIDDNDVPGRVYFDLGAQYSLLPGRKDGLVLFGNVTNLFDRNPPKFPNPAHFDVIGRYFTMGVKAAF